MFKKAFLPTEQLTDALRITLAVLLPALLLPPHVAVSTGAGALLIALADAPAPRRRKLHSAILHLVVFAFITALIASVWTIYWLTGIVLFVLAFVCALLAIFGWQYALLGTMALIMAIFTIGLHPAGPWPFTGYVIGGGVGYYILSLLQAWCLPYHSLEQAMAECTRATAAVLRDKARSYDPAVDLADCYRENIRLHIRASEKQEQMRRLLLGDPGILASRTKKQRRLFNAGIQLIDLYEQVSAIHHDYGQLRRELEPTGALPIIRQLINCQADFLEGKSGQYQELINKLRDIDAVALQPIIQNFEQIQAHLCALRDGEDVQTDTRAYQGFLVTVNIKHHLRYADPQFRFALRLALLCLGAYAVGQYLQLGNYSYWLPLTIVVVARPRMAMTRKRNRQRLFGTFMGIILGGTLLAFAPKNSVLFLGCLLLFGFLFYNRSRYSRSVICITALVILGFGAYQGNWQYIAAARLLFTLAGCALLIPAAYLFPAWENARLQMRLQQVIQHNSQYLRAISINMSPPEIRLARKNAYTALADFSQAIADARKEPEFGAAKIDRWESVQVLCYRINALSSGLLHNPNIEALLARLQQELAIVTGEA